MPILSPQALQVVNDYGRLWGDYEARTKGANEVLTLLLRESNIPFHAVQSRAKAVGSLRAKLRKRPVRQPRRLLYDAIGCRVIALYDEDVDPIVDYLGAHLDVRRMSDRRKRLRLKAFGYRSVHLIAKLRDSRTGVEAFELLGRTSFEIQVRSILEHAWAEIEHEIVYKSGAEYPKPFVRRFAAVAGSLEILGRELAGLRDEWGELVEAHRSSYARGEEHRIVFDSARLVGFLEERRPEGLGWREAMRRGDPFAPHSDKLAADALRAAGCRTPLGLENVLARADFRRRLSRYALAAGQSANEVAHLTVVLIALSILRPAALEEFFPEAFADPFLARALS